MIFVTLSCIVLVFLLLILWLNKIYRTFSDLGLENAPVTYFLGNMKPVFFQKQSFSALILSQYRYLKNKGVKHGGSFMLFRPLHYVIDPDLIKLILQTDANHFIDRGVYYNEKSDPLSAHLFSIEGQKWKNLRAKLTPTFTTGKMKMMLEMVISCADELLKVMDENIGQPLDIKEYLARFTTDVIGSCAFGIDCNSLKNPNCSFRMAGKGMLEHSFCENIRQMLLYIFPEIMHVLGAHMVNKNSSRFFIKLVEETVRFREKNNICRNDLMHLMIQLKNRGRLVDDENTTDNEKSDINGNLKKGKDSITFNELAAQAFLFFVAGFETSSSAMSFCLYELSLNKEIQDKVRKEINQVLEKHDGKITYECLGEMTYMEKVIDETLRKYPSLPQLMRICTADYKIPGTTVNFKKGDKIIIPVYGIHRDEDYYPDPERFDPERFSEEEKKSRHSSTWLPFGEGPRICIGLRFGMMQTKVGLTVLLKNYEMTLNNKTITPLVMEPRSFLLSTKGGIWLDVKKIQ